MTEPDPMLRFTIPGNPVPSQMGVLVARGRVARDERCLAYRRHVATYTMMAVSKATWVVTREDRFSVTLRAFVGSLRVLDCDNLAKSALDGIKGRAFPDDSQVTRLFVTKELDREKPRLEVEIERLVVAPPRLCDECGETSCAAYGCACANKLCLHGQNNHRSSESGA